MPDTEKTVTPTEKPKTLNDIEIRIVTYVEQKFWESKDGLAPTNEAVASALQISVKEVEKAYKNDVFRRALITRGVNLDQSRDSGLLTPQQIMAANMMFNVQDKRSIREKLKDINVSPQQYSAWQKQPAWVNYCKKRAETVFEASDASFFMQLVKNMEAGDNKALQMFGEIRGIYNPRITVDVDVNSILMQVVEVLSRHLEPERLAIVAEDLAALQVPSQQRKVLPVASRELSNTGIEDLGDSTSAFEI